MPDPSTCDTCGRALKEDESVLCTPCADDAADDELFDDPLMGEDFDDIDQ